MAKVNWMETTRVYGRKAPKKGPHPHCTLGGGGVDFFQNNRRHTQRNSKKKPKSPLNLDSITKGVGGWGWGGGTGGGRDSLVGFFNGHYRGFPKRGARGGMILNVLTAELILDERKWVEHSRC